MKKQNFDGPYDINISDLLYLWGKWSRQGVNMGCGINDDDDNALSGMSLSDVDALIIDSVLAKMKTSSFKSHRERYKVLNLYYVGKPVLIDDMYITIPLSLDKICKETGIKKTSLRILKTRGESNVEGMLLMQSMLVGQELEFIKNIKLLQDN